MKRPWLVCALLALAPVLAAAQQSDDGGDGGGSPVPAADQQPQQQSDQPSPHAQEPDGSEAQAPDAPTEEPPRKVSLEDARANVATLIGSFVAQRSTEGAWPLLDKRTRKVRRLKLIDVDERRVRPAGGALFSAPARLEDLSTGETLEAAFRVDFTGPEWRVVGMRLKAPAAAPPPPREARPARTAGRS